MGKFLEAEIVNVLHIAPAHNTDFRKVTSPELAPLGDTATGVWKRLVGGADRFQSVSTEETFAPQRSNPPATLKAWADSVSQR